MDKDNVLTAEQAKPFLAQISKLECEWDKTSLKGELIFAYPHSGGWNVEGMIGKQWLYIICPKCEYAWALWKLGVSRDFDPTKIQKEPEWEPDKSQILTIDESISKKEKKLNELFSKEQLSLIKELVRQVIVEMDGEGFWDHTHNKETGETE